jgi:predicted CoA-binding protein
MPTSLSEIQEFLSLRRIALVGLSRDPKDFSRYLFREMRARGYEMVPVNPAASEMEGSRCFAHVQEIAPAVDGALLLTPSQATEKAVRDCAQAGIRHIWMHRSGGQGSVSPQAVDFCRKQGLHLVEGYCPFMFLPHTPFFHRIHGFILKLTGAYPPKLQRAA